MPFLCSFLFASFLCTFLSWRRLGYEARFDIRAQVGFAEDRRCCVCVISVDCRCVCVCDQLMTAAVFFLSPSNSLPQSHAAPC